MALSGHWPLSAAVSPFTSSLLWSSLVNITAPLRLANAVL